MNKPPCIRGLNAFKKGCPMHVWNGSTGCPAWVEGSINRKGGGEKEKVSECLDLYMARLAWHANALLEGNQQGIESFRNGMVMVAGGQSHPKPDPALAKLALVLETALKNDTAVTGTQNENRPLPRVSGHGGEVG